MIGAISPGYPQARGVVAPATRDCRSREAGWGQDATLTRPPLWTVRPGDPGLVRRGLRRAHARPGGRLGGRSAPAGTPWSSPRPAPARPWRRSCGRSTGWPPAAARGPAAPLPGPLRLAAQGARGRRGAQPARAAHRHPPRRPPAGAAARRTSRSACAPATPPPTNAAASPHPARHPDHHARVAVPDAHLAGAGVAARGRDGDRRRGARGRRHQARRPPRALAGAARRAPRPARPAHRPVGHRPADRRGGPFLGGSPPGRGRRAADGQARTIEVVGPDRGHDRPRAAPPSRTRGSTAGARAARRSGRRRGAHVDLVAATGPHRVRQLAAAGRAAVRRLNEIAADRADAAEAAQAFDSGRAGRDIAQSAVATGAAAVARAHHGSVSREQRNTSRRR